MLLILRLRIFLAVCFFTRYSLAFQTLVVSFDGFRYDYLTEKLTPHMYQFSRSALYADFMRPSFPTETFCNHYTLVTGLYPESHGIVSNAFYDPNYPNKIFSKSDDEFWWNETKPIWIEAVLAGKNATVFFWPGSETSFGGVTATRWKKYDESISWEMRVNTVIRWLKETKAEIALLYYNQPDSTGHTFGPNSNEIKSTLTDVDQKFNWMVERLEKEKLLNSTNLVVVSDHGMAQASPERRHNLDDIPDILPLINQTFRMGAYMHIYPQEGQRSNVLEKINKAVQPDCTAYRREEIPERYNYRNNRRIAPLVVICTENATFIKTSEYPLSGGYHAYGNDEISMRAIFFAKGPNFRDGRLNELNNVDVYPLLCRLIGIDAHSNNGTIDKFDRFYTNVGHPTPTMFTLYLLLLINLMLEK